MVRSTSLDRRSSMFSRAVMKYWVAAAIAGASFSSHAFYLKINADENPENVITLSGDVSATVSTSNEGIELSIPGVNISLDCEKAAGGVAESCVVAIGSVAAANNEESGSSDSGASVGGSEGGADEDEAPSSPTPTGSAIGSKSGGVSTSTSSDCNKSSGTYSFGCSTGNYTSNADAVGAGDEGDQPDDADTGDGDADAAPCEGIGCDRATATPTTTSTTKTIGSQTRTPSTDAGSTASPFPAFETTGCGTARTHCSGINLGVGSKESGRLEVDIYRGQVHVADLYTSPSEVRGDIQWVPNSKYPRPTGALRIWISKEPDGERISEACGFAVGWESTLAISNSGGGCSVPQDGAKYYVNLAICDSDVKDYSCKYPAAVSGSGDYSLYFTTTW